MNAVADAADEARDARCDASYWLERKQIQAEDGIRDRMPSRGLGDVYKRQTKEHAVTAAAFACSHSARLRSDFGYKASSHN